MKQRKHDKTAVNPGVAIRRPDPWAGLRWALQTGIALILLFVGIALASRDEQPRQEATMSSKNSDGEEVYTPRVLQSINTHMHVTEQQTEMNALSTELENYQSSAPPIPEPVPFTHPQLVDPLETEDSAGKVYRDLYPDARLAEPVLPTDRINSMVEQDKYMRALEANKRKAYIEAIKANARADGFEVKINDQFEVESVGTTASARAK